MAEVTLFGVERELCPDPDGVGCGDAGHVIGIHSERADGCSHIGSSGWCSCSFTPQRDGAAWLLEDTAGIGTVSPSSGSALPGGAGLAGLIPASSTFKYDNSAGNSVGWPKMICAALVKVGKAYRPCKRPPEFERWVDLPPAMPRPMQKQVRVCFTHVNAKGLVFAL